MAVSAAESGLSGDLQHPQHESIKQYLDELRLLFSQTLAE